MGRDRQKKHRHSSEERHCRSPSSVSRELKRGVDSEGKARKKRSSRPYETPEERAARKREKQATKMIKSFGYTNEDNPFGDSNLTGAFLWKKKEQQTKKNNSKTQSSTQRELLDEISKVRKRRQERDAEREEQERLRNEEARLRDASQYDEWQQKEEEFHMSQARIRSHIRIREGRERPIDTIAKNILLFGTGEGDEMDLQVVDVELREPYLIFNDLSLDELRELRKEIQIYMELEGKGPNQSFWTALMVICKDKLEKLERNEMNHGIHREVNRDIEHMLSSKSLIELGDMEKEIERTIENATRGVDVEYWDGILKQLYVFQAKAQLKEIHHRMLQTQLGRLEENRKKNRKKTYPETTTRRVEELHEPSRYDDSVAARKMYAAEEEKGLDEEEEEFGQAEEIEVCSQFYSWNDKYRPRKPRYFNRVKTGYDWNKYNQTHYDHDNPPPKIVQGYKFNLFYPDLIDQSKAPTFFLEKADSQDFMIIRFHAGPPYEDIAFKIVNREWECSHKRGFKSVFERGILHLYFNFKRHRYRR